MVPLSQTRNPCTSIPPCPPGHGRRARGVAGAWTAAQSIRLRPIILQCHYALLLLLSLVLSLSLSVFLTPSPSHSLARGPLPLVSVGECCTIKSPSCSAFSLSPPGLAGDLRRAAVPCSYHRLSLSPLSLSPFPSSPCPSSFPYLLLLLFCSPDLSSRSFTCFLCVSSAPSIPVEHKIFCLGPPFLPTYFQKYILFMCPRCSMAFLRSNSRDLL